MEIFAKIAVMTVLNVKMFLITVLSVTVDRFCIMEIVGLSALWDILLLAVVVNNVYNVLSYAKTVKIV
jgi:hypothetical protein